MPAVIPDLLEESIVCKVSKNDRRVFSKPEKIFGVRNLSVIISNPHPITDKIFIEFISYEKD